MLLMKCFLCKKGKRNTWYQELSFTFSWHCLLGFFYQRWRTKSTGLLRRFSGAEVSVFVKDLHHEWAVHLTQGVFTRYNVTGPDQETPLICDQWESPRESFLKSEWDWTKQTNRLFWFPLGVRFHLWLFCSVTLFLTSAVYSICLCVYVCEHACVCVYVYLHCLCQWSQLLKR